eukprot:TRINITY_DN16332_c0_g1_i1.p1 TRINITY_DN16332_c0_g1~~TRINITY_DN16332_c0_g1_i1.p1  ORF type:complete len:606 (-),score=127.05 TRINITY_DN16332_c0_g1_i1:14-1792(-)
MGIGASRSAASNASVLAQSPVTAAAAVAVAESVAAAALAREAPAGMTLVREGKAEVLFPEGQVFYNNVQEVNRDFSVAALRLFAEIWAQEKREISSRRQGRDQSEGQTGLRVLEALSATGLRAIRYIREVPGISHIVANDLLPAAAAAIQRNLDHNGIPPELVRANQGDANLVMHASKQLHVFEHFSVIDLDPYGSAAPFLDSALQAIANGGLLCITCTDMGVLSGTHADACWAKYGVMPTRGKYCHELGLRILLSSIDAHANRHGKYIEPLLSLSIDFYVRVFVRVRASLSEVKKSSSNKSHVFQCVNCDTFVVTPLATMQTRPPSHTPKMVPVSVPQVEKKCPECNSNWKMGGPIWSAPIHNSEFAEKLLSLVKHSPADFKQSGRLMAVLSTVCEELPHSPLYYILPSLFSRVHATTPPMKLFRAALLNAGYKVTLSHAAPESIKTDAPNSVVWDIVRRWVEDHPVKTPEPSSPAWHILSHTPTLSVNWTVCPGADIRSRVTGIVRYLPNPEENWGPKSRAAANPAAEPLDSKKRRLQNKNSDKKKSRPGPSDQQEPTMAVEKQEEQHITGESDDDIPPHPAHKKPRTDE